MMLTIENNFAKNVIISLFISLMAMRILHYFVFRKYAVRLQSKEIASQDWESRKIQDDSRTTARTKKRGICPFSADTNFIVEIQDDVPPTPVDIFEEWMNPNSTEFGKPLAARWLNAGISGQDTPGILRAGLKRLPDSKYFLVEEPFRIADELKLKSKALDDLIRKPKVLVYEPDSLDAQKELLELFIEYLPRRYPNLYEYNAKSRTIYVSPIDKTFYIDEWMTLKQCPLELCERIVQEDLILMRPPREEVESENQYIMSAAAVIFSFNQLQEKLGKPLQFLHAPVPGYEKQIRKTIDVTFTKLLKCEKPMWRNNWGIDASGVLDEPLYGSENAKENRSIKTIPTRDEIKSKFLGVEYQTIRRLPRSKWILFTVKTMLDPFYSLEDVPLAASCLSASISGMSTDMLRYKGISNIETRDAIISYLDEIANGDIQKEEITKKLKL